MTDFSAEPVPTLDLKNIKGSIREFERWKDEVSAEWPQSLKDAGHIALLTPRHLDQPNAHKSAVFMASSKRDLAAFAAAYAEWSKGR